jgi:transcriptional regulator of arginine metabolism
MPMPKQARHFAIRQIIESKAIANQDDLRKELKKRGFNVTQATLSRDLHELGVGRISSGDHSRYVLQTTVEVASVRPFVGAEVTSIDANEGMIVIKTLPGFASAVGEFIDTQKHPDIIGTLAGDNTLLVIPKSHKKTNALRTLLTTQLFEGTR